jgi:hypothetical protein
MIDVPPLPFPDLSYLLNNVPRSPGNVMHVASKIRAIIENQVSVAFSNVRSQTRMRLDPTNLGRPHKYMNEPEPRPLHLLAFVNPKRASLSDQVGLVIILTSIKTGRNRRHLEVILTHVGPGQEEPIEKARSIDRAVPSYQQDRCHAGSAVRQCLQGVNSFHLAFIVDLISDLLRRKI